MKKERWTPLAQTVLVLLGALVVTNVAFLILVHTGGPFIGLTIYLILLIAIWRGRQPDYRPAAVGGFVGLVIHILEVILVGWTTYPLLMALNLILPAALVPAAWLANKDVLRAHPNR
jgi:hypothetical protein